VSLINYSPCHWYLRGSGGIYLHGSLILAQAADRYQLQATFSPKELPIPLVPLKWDCGGFCVFWFWGSMGNHLLHVKLEAELLMLLVGCWLRWPGDCSWSQLTAFLLGRLLGVLALHWCLLDGACCSVKPYEARELIWLVPTKVFADLFLSLVTFRLPERTAQTPELHCSNSTC
jgi:hypothetical protein